MECSVNRMKIKRRVECSVVTSVSAFNEFLDLCRVATKNDTVVLELMQKAYRRTDPNFIGSQDFSKLIKMSSERIVSDPSTKFVHIRHFVSELKANKAAPAKRPLHHQNQLSSTDGEPEIKRTKSDETAIVSDIKCSSAVITSSCSSAAVSSANSNSAAGNGCSTSSLIASDTVEPNIESIEILSSDEEEEKIHSLPSTVLLNSAWSKKLEVVTLSENVNVGSADSVPMLSLEPSHSADGNGAAEHSSKKFKASSTTNPRFQKPIRRLEKLLVALDERIRKLLERELTLEDMEDDDSIYLLENRYKKKFVKVWNKLCELKGVANSTGRHIEKAIKFDGTKYCKINRRISRLVNKFQVFPDFQEVFEIVNHCNEKFKMGLQKVNVASIARESFVALGKMLQERRLKDYETDMGCYLTDSISLTSDPALLDPTVRQQLISNRKEGFKRLDEVIDKYAKKQEETAKSDNSDEPISDDDSDQNLQVACEMSDSDDDVVEKDSCKLKDSEEKTADKENDHKLLPLCHVIE